MSGKRLALILAMALAVGLMGATKPRYGAWKTGGRFTYGSSGRSYAEPETLRYVWSTADTVRDSTGIWPAVKDRFINCKAFAATNANNGTWMGADGQYSGFTDKMKYEQIIYTTSGTDTTIRRSNSSADASIGVTHFTTKWPNTDASGTLVPYFWFDISEIPIGSTIVSATLWVRNVNAGDGLTTLTLSAGDTMCVSGDTTATKWMYTKQGQVNLRRGRANSTWAYEESTATASAWSPSWTARKKFRKMGINTFLTAEGAYWKWTSHNVKNQVQAWANGASNGGFSIAIKRAGNGTTYWYTSNCPGRTTLANTGGRALVPFLDVRFSPPSTLTRKGSFFDNGRTTDITANMMKQWSDHDVIVTDWRCLAETTFAAIASIDTIRSYRDKTAVLGFDSGFYCTAGPAAGGIDSNGVNGPWRLKKYNAMRQYLVKTVPSTGYAAGDTYSNYVGSYSFNVTTKACRDSMINLIKWYWDRTPNKRARAGIIFDSFDGNFSAGDTARAWLDNVYPHRLDGEYAGYVWADFDGDGVCWTEDEDERAAHAAALRSFASELGAAIPDIMFGANSYKTAGRDSLLSANMDVLFFEDFPESFMATTRNYYKKMFFYGAIDSSASVNEAYRYSLCNIPKIQRTLRSGRGGPMIIAENYRLSHQNGFGPGPDFTNPVPWHHDTSSYTAISALFFDRLYAVATNDSIATNSFGRLWTNRKYKGKPQYYLGTPSENIQLAVEDGNGYFNVASRRYTRGSVLAVMSDPWSYTAPFAYRVFSGTASWDTTIGESVIYLRGRRVCEKGD